LWKKVADTTCKPLFAITPARLSRRFARGTILTKVSFQNQLLLGIYTDFHGETETDTPAPPKRKTLPALGKSFMPAEFSGAAKKDRKSQKA
jgi:hypothetical protein